MTYYYIYKITNLINNKIYIGVHKTKNLDDGYMGSGKYIKAAIKKHGVENFSKEILEHFDSYEDVLLKEEEIVNEEFLSREDTYNLRRGGRGGFDYLNTHILSKEFKSKNGKIGGNYTFQNRLGYHNPLMIRNWKPGLDTIRKEFPKSGFYNKTHSEETKKKIGETNSIRQQGSNNSMFGMMWVTNGINSIRIKKEESIPEGWYRGRK